MTQEDIQSEEFQNMPRERPALDMQFTLTFPTDASPMMSTLNK